MKNQRGVKQDNTMKQKRNLSGVFIRFENDEEKVAENRCFEDLPEEAQKELLATKSPEWKDGLILHLANTLNDIGEKFKLIVEE